MYHSKIWEKINKSIFFNEQNEYWCIDECIISFGCHVFASFTDSMIIKKYAPSIRASNIILFFAAKISIHETVEQLAKTVLSYKSYYGYFSISNLFFQDKAALLEQKNSNQTEPSWLDTITEMSCSAFFSIVFERYGAYQFNIPEPKTIFSMDNFWLGSLSAAGSIAGYKIIKFFAGDNSSITDYMGQPEILVTHVETNPYL
jgi:hypothetical protein